MHHASLSKSWRHETEPWGWRHEGNSGQWRTLRKLTDRGRRKTVETMANVLKIFLTVILFRRWRHGWELSDAERSHCRRWWRHSSVGVALWKGCIDGSILGISRSSTREPHATQNLKISSKEEGRQYLKGMNILSWSILRKREALLAGLKPGLARRTCLENESYFRTACKWFCVTVSFDLKNQFSFIWLSVFLFIINRVIIRYLRESMVCHWKELT